MMRQELFEDYAEAIQKREALLTQLLYKQGIKDGIRLSEIIQKEVCKDV